MAAVDLGLTAPSLHPGATSKPVETAEERPALPEVTLVAASSVALDATVAAMAASMEQARFGRALLLSDRRPAALDGTGIDWAPSAPMRSKADYSRFMLHELAGHVATPFALCIQWDGFVLSGQSWDARFLEHDYIGAVWPHVEGDHRVGNGGFSLRSARLLKATRNLPYDGQAPEDFVIGRLHRRELERQGISFAPEQLADRFSYERTPPVGGEFGFHGAFNLVKLLPRRKVFSLLKSLEPQVLTRNEHKELLRWAVRSGYLTIASLLARRIIRQRLMQ